MSWEKVKLEDVGFVQGGYAFPSTEYINVGTPLIRISNIINDAIELKANTVFVNPEYLKTKPTFVIEKNDVLIAMSGATTGKFGIYNLDEPSLLNQRVGRIKLNFDKIVQKYFYYFMFQIQTSILHNAYGAAIPNISPTDIASFEIPLPNLPIQQKIASILDQADKLRKKDQQLLDNYDALLQSIFYDMFGDPVKNENNWEILKFSEVGKLDRGISKNRPRNSPELLGGIHPLIQTGDVANSEGYIRAFKSTYSELGLKQSKIWKANTLCITIAANIAKTGILKFDACFPDSIVGFIPNEKTNVEFIQLWLSHLQGMLEATAPESAQKNINLEILRNLSLPTPPIKLQNKFAAIAQNIQQQKQQIKQQQQQSEALFQTLLQKAFNGELVI